MAIDFTSDGKAIKFVHDNPDVHLVEMTGEAVKILKRLTVFRAFLEDTNKWLEAIPTDFTPPNGPHSEQTKVWEALADAALISFCKCFDKKHPLKPLNLKMFTLEERDKIETLITMRNKTVAHDDQKASMTFVIASIHLDGSALDVASIHLSSSFYSSYDMKVLKHLSSKAFELVDKEHQITIKNALSTLKSQPPEVAQLPKSITIGVRRTDRFGPKNPRQPKR